MGRILQTHFVGPKANLEVAVAKKKLYINYARGLFHFES